MEQISETKHLNTGDLNPPKTPNCFRLYSMKYCPFAERVRLTLNVKNIEYEIVNINLHMKPEWYLKVNPKGNVPALDTGLKVMTESLDICNFLDEQFPKSALWNSETKNEDLEIMKNVDHICMLFDKAIRNTEKKNLKEHIEGMQEDLEKLNAILEEKRDGPFFGGKSLNMIDIALWPFAERYEILPMIHNGPLPSEINQKYHNICKWINAMKNEEPIKRAILSPEKHYQAMLLLRGHGKDTNYVDNYNKIDNL